MRRCILKEIHYLTFDLDPYPKVKVVQNVTQYPLHHVAYTLANFEVATFNSLGRDIITRSVSDGHMEGQTDDGSTLVRNYYYHFSYEKAGVTNALPVFVFSPERPISRDVLNND